MTNVLTIYQTLENENRNSPSFFENTLSFIQSLSVDEIWELLLKKEIISQKYQEEFKKIPQKFLSVEELANDWVNQEKLLFKTNTEEDLAKICLVTLWQNLHPQTPCSELFEFFVQRGYLCISSDREEQALKDWKKAEEVFLYISEKLHLCGICSIRELLEQQYEIDIWIQDYLTNLLETYDLEDLKTVRNFSENVLQLFSKEVDTIVDSVKISYIQSFSLHQDYKKSDSLYEKWLQENSDWVQGWIAWADTYWIYDNGAKDIPKAVFILEQASNKVSTENRLDILLRLKLMYQKNNFNEAVNSIEEEIKTIQMEQEKLKDLEKDPLIESLMRDCNLSEEDLLD